MPQQRVWLRLAHLHSCRYVRIAKMTTRQVPRSRRKSILPVAGFPGTRALDQRQNAVPSHASTEDPDVAISLQSSIVLLCLMPLAIASAWAQNPTGDERMRACVSVLSRGLESGMTADDYPDQARRDGRTGTTQVQFSVSHTGKMEHASLAHGSGDPDLDQAAVGAAQRIFPSNSPCARTMPSRLRLYRHAGGGVQAARAVMTLA
jgi:TonB family protein